MTTDANPLTQLTHAYDFAARKHVDHRRKGDAAEPYMNHLTEVATLVARATDGRDVEVVIAAVLHDAVEDTDATFEELTALFGPRVANLVREVTDDDTLPSATRKALQIAHAADASPGAKIIKLADKTSNIRSMAASPPSGWSPERRAAYVAWAVRVVDRCRDANAWLAARFDAAVEALPVGRDCPPGKKAGSYVD